MSRFYVYTLAYPDGTVFYVGKGTGNRINEHELEARRGAKSYKCNVIRQVERDGGKVVKTVVQNGMTDEAAYLLEIDLIRMYGREHLTNLTDGGEGAAGRPCPDENITLRIWKRTHSRLRFVAAMSGESIVSLIDRLSKEELERLNTRMQEQLERERTQS